VLPSAFPRSSRRPTITVSVPFRHAHTIDNYHEELNRRTWPTSRRLLPDGDRVIIYRRQCFAYFTLLEHMELTLNLEGKARRKALSKTPSLLDDVPPSPSKPDRA
jgi:hypothetical protein